MGLVCIAKLVDSIEDRNALFQECDRLLSALDLTNVALGQASGAQETMTHRARCHVERLIVKYSVHERLLHQQTLTDEPVYKRVRIFIVGILPRRAIQPERVTAHV